MSSDRIQVNYIYTEGNVKDIGPSLSESHIRALKQHEHFEWDSPFIRTEFGTVEIGPIDTIELNGMDPIENHTYNQEDEEWDLYQSPAVTYSINPNNKLRDSSNTSAGTVDTELVEQFAKMVAIGYESTEQTPLAAYAQTPVHSSAIFAAGEPPATAESLAHNKYEHLSWVTVFTPPMIETYGRETLLSAPAWQIRELDNGAILVVSYQNPFDPNPDKKEDVADYIGLKSFPDAR
jgi:hypothetical protein